MILQINLVIRPLLTSVPLHVTGMRKWPDVFIPFYKKEKKTGTLVQMTFSLSKPTETQGSARMHANHDKVASGTFELSEAKEGRLCTLEFAKQHRVIATNTTFQHKESRTATWHSPGVVTPFIGSLIDNGESETQNYLR